MKFALVNGQRQTAQPELRGICPECEQPVIARCGEIRVEHWAHKVRSNCNNRWETEGPWHRNWKGQFPDDWQEIVHYAEDGERHIADVKTAHGYVIEFQHSYIKPEERRSREASYPKLVWVVDGLRRTRDKYRFLKTWEEGDRVRANSPVRRVWSGEGALLRDWAGSRVHVFFDLGDEQALWWLSPISDDWWAYVARISRAEFIETHRRTGKNGACDFDSFVQRLSILIPANESQEASNRRIKASEEPPPRNFEREFLLMGRRARQRRYRPRGSRR